MSNDKITSSELILNPDGSVYHLHLKPNEVSTSIITVGDPDRATEIARRFASIEFERRYREFVTITGTYKGKRLTIISTGIGTDNIDIVLNEIDALFQIDLEKRQLRQEKTVLNFIRIGTSGAMQADIPVDSFLATKSALAFDGLLPFYASNRFKTPESWPTHLKSVAPYIVNGTERFLEHLPDEIKTGITATMPGFYAPQGRRFRLPSIFKDGMRELVDIPINGDRITNLEMETSGIYGLCELMGHNSISFNALLANRITGEFSSKPKTTIENLIDISLDWIVENVD